MVTTINMTKLSVNINKIALLRNSRNLNIPNLIEAVDICIKSGADGITIHPRPDERHIRFDDVIEISNFIQKANSKNKSKIVEFNIEGNPFIEPYLELVKATCPHQCTLVPDTTSQFTSDHGWEKDEDFEKLKNIIVELKKLKTRISLFMDPINENIEKASSLSIDRIELYTENFARAFDIEKSKKNINDSESQENKKNISDTVNQESKKENNKNNKSNNNLSLENEILKYRNASKFANSKNLSLNAGHDLNLNNLGYFLKNVPNILEVSIGHALIADSIFLGLSDTVKKYLDICKNFKF